MDPLHLANFGLSTNQYGGVYIDGVSYGITTRIRVAKTILERRKQGTYSLRSVAKEMQVGKGYVSRVAQELDSGGIIDPRTARHHCERGPGSLTLDDYDLCVLILLLRENPSRSLESYCRNLFDITGTIVSTSTVSRVWSHAFELKASFLKPNLVPRDKFKYENVARAREFIDVVQRIDPVRLKFCDEKHLKGAEIYNQKCRRDPLTGVVADLPTDSDFRNTWTIIGFCGYDMSTVPFITRFGSSLIPRSRLQLRWREQLLLAFSRKATFLCLTMQAFTFSKRMQFLKNGYGTSLVFSC